MFPRKTPDPRDPRASSLLFSSDAFEDGDFVLVGLPFDSSIPSRPGARMGPRAFRDALPSLTTFGRDIELAGHICRDLGDIDLPPTSVRVAHERVQAVARELFERRAQPFFIGGDNGLTGAIFRGLAEARPDLRLGIAAIDSHYDVREYDGEESLFSGTPYRRALETGIVTGERLFLIGARDFANASYYDRWVREQKINVVPVETFDHRRAADVGREIRKKIESLCDAIFISIDIDAVELPGSSAAAPGGFQSREVIALVRELAQSPQVIGCDLSELSPPWDVSGLTAKLAARLFLEVFAATIPRR
jgi:formimidoylglutamase